MSTKLSIEEKYIILQKLAAAAIVRLQSLLQPVVRVSGPLTSGGFGYEENLRRLLIAQQKLREAGYTVFDYFEDNQDEQQIVALEISDWREVMNHYHRPIMATGLLSTVFMMPCWQESNGAKDEHAFATELGLKIEELPEAWFSTIND